MHLKYIIMFTSLIMLSACLGGNDDREECHETTILDQYDFSNIDYSGTFVNGNDFEAKFALKIANIKYLIATDTIELEYNILSDSTYIMQYEINQEYAGINNCIYSYNHIIEEYRVPVLQLTMVSYKFNGITIPLDKNLNEKEQKQMYYFNDRQKTIEKYHISRGENSDKKLLGIRFNSYDIYRDSYTKKDMPGRFDCSVCN